MKPIKKSACFVKGIIIVSVIFFLTDCSKVRDLGVYDKSIPPNQQCTLFIDKNLTVTRFNGKWVRWSIGQFRTKGEAKIQIPAGHHEFRVNFSEYDASTREIHYVKKINVSKNLKAGDIYHLSSFRTWNKVEVLIY